MKLTQELVVSIVFLSGSWVILSVVADAYPPTTSTIRYDILNAPTKKSQAAETSTAMIPSEETTTFLKDEKPAVVQVITADLKNNEFYILGENENISEKIIEENPDAAYAVMGADEENAKTKIQKFNVASQHVAIKVALAKAVAAQQAEADNQKIQEWQANSSRFAVEVKAKKFNVEVNDVLRNNLQELAEIPEFATRQIPNITPATTPENSEARIDAANIHEKLTTSDKALRVALEMSRSSNSQRLICDKDAKALPQQNKHETNNIVKSTAAHQEDNAELKSMDLRPLNEKLTLQLKQQLFAMRGKHELTAALASLVQTAEIKLPFNSSAAYLQSIETKENGLTQTSMQTRQVVNAQPTDVPAINKITMELKQQHNVMKPLDASAFYQLSAQCEYHPAKLTASTADKLTKLPAEHAVPQAAQTAAETAVMKKVQTATAKVLKHIKQVAVNQVKANKTSAQHRKITAAVHLASRKQLAMAEQKHPAIHSRLTTKENALQSLERQLSNDPVVVVHDRPVQRRVVAEQKPQQQRPHYQAPQVVQPDQQEQHYQQSARTVDRSPAYEKDPFEAYFEQQEMQQSHSGQGDYRNNIASIDEPRTEVEAKDMSNAMHNPEEYSRLMED